MARAIQYSDNRDACLRILNKAIRRKLLVSDGDVTSAITVNCTQPIAGIGKGDTVNLFARKNACFDKVALGKISRFCTKSLPKTATLQERFDEMSTEQLAAMIAVCQLGSYNCNQNAPEVKMYTGRKCKLTIGSATKTSSFGEEASFFAVCAKVLGLPSTELDIVAIDGFIPMADAVSTVNFGGATSNQFAGWDLDEEEDEDEEGDDEPEVYSAADFTPMKAAALKSALTSASITFPATANEAALRKLAVDNLVGQAKA
jgi:hypothetical protein